MINNSKKFFQRILLNKLQQASSPRRLLPTEVEPLSSKVKYSGQTLTSFASADFFQLSHHPEILKNHINSLEKCGFGMGSSRLSAGTSAEVLAAEARLASFFGTEAAIILPSRSQACLSLFGVFLNERDVLIFSENSETPLADIAYLMNSAALCFNSKNLFKTIEQTQEFDGLKVLVLDSLEPSLEDFEKLKVLLHGDANNYADAICVDETFTLGTCGIRGAGLADKLELGVFSTIIYGDLGFVTPLKAGFVAGPKEFIAQILARSRILNLEAAVSSAMAQSLIVTLDILDGLGVERLKLKTRAEQLHTSLLNMPNFAECKLHLSPMLTLKFHSVQEALNVQKAYIEQGFLLDAVNYSSTVGAANFLRVFINSLHTEEDLAKLIDCSERIAKRLSR